MNKNKLEALGTKKSQKLKEPIDNKATTVSALEKLLLNGPVATKRQLEQIAQTRNAIKKWQGLS